MQFLKKKNKLWLGIGAITSTALISATIVSCVALNLAPNDFKTLSKENIVNLNPNSNQPNSIKNVTSSPIIKQDWNLDNSNISNININSKVLESPLQVLDSANNLTTVSLPNNQSEGFVLAKYYYSGQINNSSNGIGYISANDINFDSIQMGKNDSLLLVFNQNLKYNLKQMQAYINTLYFNDVSIGNWAINQAGDTQGQYIKFDNTELSHSYYGSTAQNIYNPPSMEVWLSQIAPSYKNNPVAWKALLNFYGFMVNSNGQYVNNPNGNPQFIQGNYPLGIIPQNLWTIKQVASNAFAFTYNANLSQVPAISDATISQISSVGTTPIQLTPVLSLGTPYEWNSFMIPGGMEGFPTPAIGQKLKSYSAPITTNPLWNVNPDMIINTNESKNELSSTIKTYLNYLGTIDNNSSSKSNDLPKNIDNKS